MNAEKKITIIGAGMIGAGLAVNSALHGYRTILYDVCDLEIVKKRMEDIMDIMVKCGAAAKEQTAQAMELVSYTGDMKEAVEGALLVEECLPERLELKQSVYGRIQEITGAGTLIASSTSGLLPSKLQEGALYPEAIMAAHPYNPSYLLPLIELCGGKKTSRENIEKAKEIFCEIGKVPIICQKEVEGFLVNKLSWACMSAAQEAVNNGLCSVEDIDKAIMFGPGMRMAVTGQLLTISLGCEGGFLALAEKYGKEPSAEDKLYAAGVEQEILNRLPEQGNTVESVCGFRDYMFAELLKLHGLL